jgi:AcrR family transcriptional regulator
MADVASGADVSRALVYRYFPAKRDLFAAIYQRDRRRRCS